MSRFGLTGVVGFGPISKVGHFGRILGVSRFGLFVLFWENSSEIRLSLPNFSLIKLTKVMYLTVFLQFKNSFLFGKFCRLTTQYIFRPLN